MRELKRSLRVGWITAKKDPVLVFLFWLLVIHVGFVIGYATLAILAQ